MKASSGVITVHAPFPVSLFESEENFADVTDKPESRKSRQSVRTRRSVRSGKKDEASPSRSRQGLRQDQLSHPSYRQLQATMEAENQQLQEMIQPILKTEKDIMMELDCFLSQRDVTELRRKELLHKHWTERVWFPLQKGVEDRVSSCGPVEARRRQGLYSHYLHHCNSKGGAYLDTYNLREYNPFLLNIKRPHKLMSADPDLHLHERLTEKRASAASATGSKYTLRNADKLPQPSSQHLFSASTSPSSTQEEETTRQKSSRLNSVSAWSDGRWCCRTGARQRQLWQRPTSK